MTVAAPTRVVLVRHGESVATVERVVGGHKGCTGLSARGGRQVELLANRLVSGGELAGASAVYSSILPRALETADGIAGALGLSDVRADCRFCELHPGEADGMAWEEAVRRFRPDYRPGDRTLQDRMAPGAESWAEMVDRVRDRLDELVADHAGSTVVVACHGGVVLSSMLSFLGLAAGGIGRSALDPPENTSLTEWTHEEGGWTLVRYNDHAHLVLDPAGAPSPASSATAGAPAPPAAV